MENLGVVCITELKNSDLINLEYIPGYYLSVLPIKPQLAYLTK